MDAQATEIPHMVMAPAPPRRLQRTFRVLSAGAKGGPGKTFLVKNLSAAAADEGYNVGVVDFDEQRSLTKWLARRARKSPERVGIFGYECDSDRVEDAEEALILAGHDIVFYDTPPAFSLESQVLKNLAFGSDLILVPSLVGITDTESAESLLRGLAGMKRPTLAIVNKVKPKASRVISLAKKRLLRCAELAPIEIGEYYDFLAADEVGLGATEIQKCIGSDDISAIWSVVKRRLGLDIEA